MKKILLAVAAVAAVAALGAAPTTFAADTVGAAELARTQSNIAALQADKRQVVLDTLALSPEQLGKLTIACSSPTTAA
jgi:hypothetical protein